MVSFNKVVLGGNLTRDPELRFTQSGIPVANFGLAVNRVRSKQSSDEVDFFDVTVWRELAETIANYKQKGDPILIEGRLQFRQWEAADGSGAKRNKVEVVAENVQFLAGGNGSSAGTGQSGGQGRRGQGRSGSTSGASGAGGGTGRGGDHARGEDVVPEDDEDFDDIPFRALIRRPLVF